MSRAMPQRTKCRLKCERLNFSSRTSQCCGKLVPPRSVMPDEGDLFDTAFGESTGQAHEKLLRAAIDAEVDMREFALIRHRVSCHR